MARHSLSVVGACGLLWASLALGEAAPAAPQPSGPAAVFSEVWTLVRDNFFDPKLRGVDWEEMRRRYGEKAASAPNRDAVAVVINAMLAELHTSHTHYYTRDDPEYYQLLSIFHEVPDVAHAIDRLPRGVCYSPLGLLTESIDGQVFVRGVTGSRSEFLVGDRIVTANGKAFHPVNSFVVPPGQPVRIELVVQRTADPASRFTVTFERPADRTDPCEPFVLEPLGPTSALLERQGRSIGHLRVWSWAGAEMQAAVESRLADLENDGAEGLILDVREGWGGASPDYLHIFRCDVPEMASIDRQGESHRWFRCWSKPVVLLINEKTRSGKEVVAYGFRKYEIGPVVGSRTAGAVTAGRPFVLSDGSLLYLAVADVLVDGERLEGVGVAPDIEVPSFDIRYTAGADPQLERAIEVLLEHLPPPASEKTPE